MHERYSYCKNISHISVILWGYVLILYSGRGRDAFISGQRGRSELESGFKISRRIIDVTA